MYFKEELKLKNLHQHEIKHCSRLEPFYSKCDLWTSTPGSLLEIQTLRAQPNLITQNLNFNNIPR